MTEQEVKSKAFVEGLVKNHPVAKRARRIEKMEREHAKMKAALISLRDYDPRTRSDTVRKIAREALGR